MSHATCGCGHADVTHKGQRVGIIARPDGHCVRCRCDGFVRRQIHNHGAEEGLGLACRVRRVDGLLVGECQPNAAEKPND